MKKIAKTLGLFAICLAAAGANAQPSAKEFKNPAMQYRPIPLWFWNNTAVEPAQLHEEFRNMIEKDRYGGCAILPFGQNFSPEYLSEEYFSTYGSVIGEAAGLGAHMSIYDEYGFPSGSMGAINADGIPRLMNKYPDATIKRLDKTEYTAAPGATFRQELPTEGRIMSVVAMDTLTKRLVSLTGRVNTNTRTLSWQAPQGAWKVMVFTCVKDGDPNVDYLDPEAVKLFVEETHEKYYGHFGERFGGVITSTFFDEPTMYRAQGRMWTNNFNEKFEARHGFSPELLYPALWYDIGPDTPSAHNLMFGMRAQLYAEGFMKTIQEWAAEHGILSTGHQDQEEVVNPVSISGDLMLCGKYMDVPGIDKIGGDRPAELFYKVVSSSAYNWDKQLVMSETYGAMGNISVQEMYQIAMDQYTKGINYLIPHAVWYNDDDVAFLPELSYRNPLYNKELPGFNTFLARLNRLLRPEGRHVADIAMLYPIESMQGDHYLDGPEGFYAGGVVIPDADYVRVSALLTDKLGKDFTYLHPEVLDEKCTIEGNSLTMENKINRESFRVLIVPGMRTISVGNLCRIEEFAKAGGHVIFTTLLPSQSAEYAMGGRIRAIMERLTGGTYEGRVHFVENPDEASLGEALVAGEMVYDVDFAGGEPLRYIHKVCGGKSVYLLANLGATPFDGEVILRGHIVPQLLDPHTGATKKVKYEYRETGGVETTAVKLAMDTTQARFLVEK